MFDFIKKAAARRQDRKYTEDHADTLAQIAWLTRHIKIVEAHVAEQDKLFDDRLCALEGLEVRLGKAIEEYEALSHARMVALYEEFSPRLRALEERK